MLLWSLRTCYNLFISNYQTELQSNFTCFKCSVCTATQFLVLFTIIECQGGTTFGKKCSFTCKSKAKMAPGDSIIECEEDGRWSTAAAHCIMTCQEPAVPKHSKPVDAQCTGNTARGVQLFRPGTTCKFRCREGFRANRKNKYNKRVIRLRCKKSGLWSGDKCEPISCRKPSPQILAFYNCTKENWYASKCTFTCPKENVSALVIIFTRAGRYLIS